jgi:hypothetical protein
VIAAAEAVRTTDAGVLVLTGFDYDAGLVALAAFDRLVGKGHETYPYRFALRPNTGEATGLDLDGDGRLGGPGDAQGFGQFAGQGGMAVLSRWPIDVSAVRDFSDLRWRDLPHADLPPHPDGTPFPSEDAQAAQRLSTTGHWDVPVMLEDGSRLHLLVWYGSPPVFDGPEDRNGKRAADEVRFWQRYLDGDFGPPPSSFVLAGIANLDPNGGDGDRQAIAALLDDKRLQDPIPGLPTAYWPEPVGDLRVDYVLPSIGLPVMAAGVMPRSDAPGAPIHRAVWVDLTID